MERRFILFLVLSFAILFGSSALMQRMNPRKPPQNVADRRAADTQADKQDQKTPSPAAPAEKNEKAGAKAAETKKSAKSPAKAKTPAEPEPAEQWVTLGSADPKDPYRMLVTLTNRGAALARIELNSPRYCDVDERYGYMGHVLVSPNCGGDGCPVQVVGPGTPAAEAGLKPGDSIKTFDGVAVSHPAALERFLKRTRPKQTVKLTIVRGGKEQTLSVTLRRRPLEVVRPENDDPLSMLLTLQQFDGRRIVDEEKEDEEAKEKQQTKEGQGDATEVKEREAVEKEARYQESLHRELKGVQLRTANWRIAPTHEKDAVQFRRVLPGMGLEITKTYRLVPVSKDRQADGDYPAYDLEFEIAICNIEEKPASGKVEAERTHKVAYRLDGPNGLPTEGAWYSTRVSRNWGGAGLRDFVISFGGGTPGMIGASTVASGGIPSPWPDESLSFIGVDAQYFSAVLMPQRDRAAPAWFDELLPIRVNKIDARLALAHKGPNPNLTNTSCRLISLVQELEPGKTLTHKFKLFAGPKKPAILAPYKLSELVYFGWPIFAVAAVPLTAILHAFYAVVGNYGLAIVLLTVFVRACMFPLSLKQAASAQKMQLLQPEIKKLAEKYKNNSEARAKAQQELFRKHNHNPLGGCLPIFIQMPIFMGLYRALMVDIGLRDAPLLSHAVRWCSNLAAPDMLYNWSAFMPDFVNSGVGMFGLGPYFNLLPLLTIGLFIAQQKMFMPPPADEQAATQQKVMQYMMIFMGLMFFKVASGLCLYFIVSSLWGMGERRFLPKPAPIAAAPETRAQAKAQARRLAADQPKKASILSRIREWFLHRTPKCQG